MKKVLLYYGFPNVPRVILQVIEMEKGGGGDGMQGQITELSTKISQMEITAQSKDNVSRTKIRQVIRE